jgi:hypothetical protein
MAKKETWNTSIDDIEKNLKDLRKQILDTVRKPTYTITYPNLYDTQVGEMTETVDSQRFREIFHMLGSSGYFYDQAQIAAEVINERFMLPNIVVHQLNNLTTEINKFKRMVEDSKIKEVYEEISKNKKK